MSKLTIQVDQETFDAIFKDTLVNDYISLRNDNRRLVEQGLENLPQFMLEDYNFNCEVIDGMEAVFKYYLLPKERESVIHDMDALDEAASQPIHNPNPFFGGYDREDFEKYAKENNIPGSGEKSLDKLEKKLDALLEIVLRRDI